MKLLSICIFAACLTASATGLSQKVTLNLKNVPIQKVFTEVIRQTGVSIVYNEALFKDAAPVSINVKNEPLAAVLELCLKNLPLEFTMENNAIVVKSKPVMSSAGGGNRKVESEAPEVTAIDISGRVTDSEGTPLAGASVKVKGTTNGTTTDANGVFVLKGVDENATLIFSYAEHETVELKVNGRTTISAALKKAETSLQEVVINKGYYTEKQKYSVGNVGRVTAKDIEKQPVNNPLLALQGRVPGLQITQANGIPGGGVTVRIQGQNSIGAGNDPLYVVDGVPYPSQMLPTTSAGNNILGSSGTSFYNPTGFGNPLSYINPEDIESIEILKDADATSIFGSRAANGAILITTKSGKAGPIKIDLGFQQGVGMVTRSMDVLNNQEYLEMRKEALRNDGIVISRTDANYDVNGLWDQDRYTDWVKVLSGGTAKFTTFNASVSGGNTNVQYLVRGTYKRETTVFKGDYNDQKGGLHFNLTTKSLNGKFRLQFSGTYLTDNNQLPRNDYTFQAYILPPNAPALYKDDGGLNWAPNLVGNSSWTNPLSEMYQNYHNKTDNLISSTLITYNILSDLEFSSRLGYSKLSTNELASSLSLAQKPENRLPDGSSTSASYTNSELKTFIIEPQLTYKRLLGNGKMEVMLGTTIQKSTNAGQSLLGNGYATDALVGDMRSAKLLTVNSTIDAIYHYNAAFVRFNYNLKDRYIINLTGRRDGSSRFGPENRFHNFGSAGIAWIFSEEKFIKTNLPFLSFGKIRGSYGTTGNDQIGDYLFMDLYSTTNPPVPYQLGSSLGTSRIPNPYLQWEETNKLSIGLDLGFWDDKILISAVYGRNRSSNQLMPYSLPITAGFAQIDRNFPAMVQNKTLEFAINTKNTQTKNFDWNSSINLTIPQNKLLKFPSLEESSYANSLFIGQPLSIVQAYQFEGVDPATGIYQFEKRDGTITTTPSSSTDRIVLINVDPKLYGGFQNSFRFKQFQIDIFFQGVKQTQHNSMQFGKSGRPGTFGVNQPTSVLNRWQKPGDVTYVQRFGTGTNLSTPFSRANQSAAAYVNISYIRLENLSLSYQLPDHLLKKFHLRNGKLYIQGQNLLTITRFGGIDPENRSFGSLAPLKVLTVGLQVGL